MELPQPRPFKAQGREPTHDFLSLCSHSTVQTDPKPTPSSSHAGSHLKTHDFLQPLESVGGSKEETSRIDTTSEPPAPPPPLKHVLPGGIGTYTISSIPYFHNHQRVPKPELSPPMMFTASGGGGGGGGVERNVVDAAAVASGLTLWDESGSGTKGQTRKENNAGERANIRADAATTIGQWPAQSLTNNNPLSGFSSRSSSQGSGLKSQSFMDMIRSAKGTSQDDDLDDEDDFFMKKESSSTSQIRTVDMRVKAEARGAGNNDPKMNTPRSKHSATEQRRRSKINDRFQKLRQLVPNSDQKRDKASFLLEVIEYIQFLQEKTSKYETPYQGWNQEPAKLLNWQRNNQQLVPEGTVAFAPKLEEEKNNIPILATAETLNRVTPFPLSVQSNSLFSPVIAGNPLTQLHARVVASESSPSSRSHTQPLKEGGGEEEEEEQGDDEEGREGNISISSVYSQGLVKRLREALEKSGVDITKATISVEIELAKRSSEVKQTRKPKRLKTCNTS
uniref:BHLH domain-containing protein n=1 Tax=Brassica napus TaxID=3708 RepID=A0A679KIW7_BRANA|nr:Unknown [Brassica napus]CAA8392266.1 Unknown [Brassica napus]CAA8403925.1 Unknown [Brassica napus]